MEDGAHEHDDLRALQAPLKEKYRVEPDAALITLTARGQIGEGLRAAFSGSGAR
jgi:hypothetical protein